MDVSQYMGMFLEESMDNLQTLNEALLDLEQEPDNIDKVNEIFRVAHTIKGMAATMGFSNIAELTHKMEDVLSKFREGKLQVSRNVVTVLFECLDTLERMVSNIEEGNDEEVEIENIMKSLENVGNEKISINKQEEMTEEHDTNKGNEVSKDSINSIKSILFCLP